MGFALFGLAEREARCRSPGSTNCKAVWTASGVPEGDQDARCGRQLLLHCLHSAHPCASSRLESIPRSLLNTHRRYGLFFGLAEREARCRSSGSTNCKAVWTASGVPEGDQDARCGRQLLLHCLHSAHPCASSRFEFMPRSHLNTHRSRTGFSMP